MTFINRPFMSSFNLSRVAYSEKHMDQFHKLVRNFVASLDLGCPSAKHVSTYDGHAIDKITEHERYLIWVKAWKQIYRELSKIIRQYKTYRRTVRFPKLTYDQSTSWALNNLTTNLTAEQGLASMSERHLKRLQETAMVLLNARYNAKLASAERVRRIQAQMAKELDALAAA